MVMSTIGSLIAKHDPDFLLLTSSVKMLLTSSVVLYSFRVISSSEMSDLFKDHLGWSGQQCIDFRKASNGNGYLQKDLKFYIYQKLATSDRVRSADFGVLDVDAKWFRAFLNAQCEHVGMLLKKVRQYRREYKPRTLAVFDKTLGLVLEKLQVSCRKYVALKFKFLTQSGQLDKDGLVNELLEKAIYAIYKAYPVIESKLHMENIGIQTIHNRGTNIILQQTSKSRRRVEKNKDGTFSGTVLSLNQGLNPNDSVFVGGFADNGICTPLITGLDGTPVDLERVTDVNRKQDLAHAVDRMLNSLPSRKQRRFVELLMGEYDDEFSEWLGVPNDEALHQMTRLAYADKIREYIGVDRDRAQKLVKDLRESLKDFRN